MDFKKISNKVYDTVTCNIDRFKTCYIEVIFQSKVEDGKMSEKAMLADYITNCSMKYPKRKDILIKNEELYRPSIYAVTNKVGGVLLTSFNLGFINPKYIKEKNYLEKIIDYFTELIRNPLFIDEKAELKNFNIVKNNLKNDLMSINESADRISVKRALENIKGDSLTKVNVLGSLEEIENITPSTLFNTYDEVINKSPSSVYILGDLDMKKVSKLLEDKLNNKIIKTKRNIFYIDNVSVSKYSKKVEESSFIQSNIVTLFNLNKLDDVETNVTFDLFNFFFGSSPLQSKLYKYIRTEASLTYSVTSTYLKYDKLLLVTLGVKKGNEDIAIKLIKKSLLEMQKGLFSDEEFINGKNNIMNSLKRAMDDPSIILRYMVFNHLINIPIPEQRLKLLKGLTKDDVIKLAKKVKLNSIYILKGGK